MISSITDIAPAIEASKEEAKRDKFAEAASEFLRDMAETIGSGTQAVVLLVLDDNGHTPVSVSRKTVADVTLRGMLAEAMVVLETEG